MNEARLYSPLLGTQACPTSCFLPLQLFPLGLIPFIPQPLLCWTPLGVLLSLSTHRGQILTHLMPRFGPGEDLKSIAQLQAARHSRATCTRTQPSSPPQVLGGDFLTENGLICRESFQTHLPYVRK